jgi:tetratricopeptide (TPR) repeat protein
MKQAIPAGRSRLSGNVLWPLAVLLITCIAYLPVLRNGFLTSWDDNRYVTDNPHIRDLSGENVLKIFTLYYDGHYHPLTLLSLGLDYSIGELDPQTYHTTNLILHLLNTLLVYLFLLRLFRRKEIAVIAALLFGINTTQVESVAWITERKNLLCAFFFFLSLISYTSYVRKGNRTSYLASVALFVLALLSKVMALPLVGVLFIMDYLEGRSMTGRKALLEKTPFILAAVVFGIIGILAQKHTWGEDLSQLPHPFFERLLYSVYAYVVYIVHAVVPVKLSGMYPYPGHLSGPYIIRIILCFLALGAVVLAFLYTFRRLKVVAFGILFYTVNIVLLLKLFEVPAGDYILADRYSYMASLGLFIIIGYGFEWIRQYRTRLIKFAGLILAGYCFLLFLLTFSRAQVWRDDISFFSDIIEKDPSIALAWNNRGAIRKTKGDLNGALGDFSKVIEMTREDYKAFANRGSVYLSLNQMDKAIADYDRAIELNAGLAELYANRGYARQNNGDLRGALEDFNISLRIKPDFAEVYSNRGTVRYIMGDFPGALEDYRATLRQDPSYFNAYYNIGLLMLNMGKPVEALDNFNKAVSLNPSYAEAYANRAVAFSRLGKMEEAFRDYAAALRLKPGLLEAYLNRGIDYLGIGKAREALDDLNTTLKFRKDIGAVYYYRALALLSLGQRDAACKDLTKALGLGFNDAEKAFRENCK